MIKFFRRTRKKLLSEYNPALPAGRFSKYLLYAIGEIFLVVIGIMIALQVNNWNQSNQEREIEQTYLNNLFSDLKDQQSSIGTQLKFEQSFFEATAYIIKDYEKNKTLTLDSVFFGTASHLRSRKTFVIIDPTYTDLISSGKINILHNAVFKDKLIKYYQELERIEKIVQNNNLLVDQVYSLTYSKIGYDYQTFTKRGAFKNPLIHKNMVSPGYEPELQAISVELLSNNNHLLEFMNNITLRNSVAIGNYLFMQELQITTDELIKELDSFIKG